MVDAELLNALKDGARDVLADQCASPQLHHFIDHGEAAYDRALWTIAADLGWLMLAVPEAHGGLGGGVEEAATLQRELGRFLAPVPILTTVLVELALARWPLAAVPADLLPRLATGTVTAGVGQIGRGQTGSGSSTLKARREGNMLTIDGECRGILDGAAADILLVEVAAEDGGRGLALLERGPGVVTQPEPIADRTRTLVTLSCRAATVSADRALFGADAATVAEELARNAAILIANDAIGGAEALLDLTVEYLKTRVQFGKPIGSFQALKHRCANHKVAIEAARTLVDRAQAETGPAAADAWAGLAKSSACDAYAAIGVDAVQMHGGIGFTWEHDAHLYFKRAALDQYLFGSSADQLDRVGALLLAAEAA